MPELLGLIRAQYALDSDGIHGVSHWKRVLDNGLRLCGTTGADPKVVALFAFLHDSKRTNEGRDPDHGMRAASFAEELAGVAFELSVRDLERLVHACRLHSDGLTLGDITVVTCWDADRLDLGRVGIKPCPDALCTDAARDPDIMDWAYRRSLG